MNATNNVDVLLTGKILPNADIDRAAAAFAKAAGGVACLQCGHRQTDGTECERCGVIFRKREERAVREARAAAPQGHGVRGLHGLIEFIFKKVG